MAAIPTKPEMELFTYDEVEEIPELPQLDSSLEDFPPVPGPITLESTPRQDQEAAEILSKEKELLADKEPPRPLLFPDNKVDPNSQASQRFAKRNKASLSLKSLAFRNRFIAEYIVDF